MPEEVLVYVRTNNQGDRALAEQIRTNLETRGIRHRIVDLCMKYRLYGNEFTYEAQFANDFSQIAGLTHPSLPLAIAGRTILSGPQAILDSLPSLQDIYGSK